MSNKTNKFLRVKHHLKSEQIDEKIAVLEGAPTNSTQNLMTVEPSVQVASTYETVSLGLDFDKGNDDDDGKDTSGVFGSDGTILTVEPDVGDTSYILGPMASMWYAWGNFTRIGYIRESDRKMVNLGSITGQLGAWDGSSNFTSYGQLTVEQALWFQEIGKKDGANNDTPNYRAFYPGPPSSTADAFGRYLAVIVGEGKTRTTGAPRGTSSPVQGTEDASSQFSAMMNLLRDKLARGERLTKKEEELLKAQESGGLDALVPSNRFQEFGNKLARSIEDALKTAGEYLFQPQSEIDGKRGQGNRLIQGNENRNQGVTSANRYNLSLAVELVNSIVTGQPREIPISPKAAINMGNSMNPEALLSLIHI